jgi:hypothetical protein
MASRTNVPILLVANMPLKESDEFAIRESIGIEFALWRNGADDNELSDKLGEIFAQLT